MRKHRTGFTVIELIITIVVVAILATLIVVGYNGVTKQARVSAVKQEVSQAAKKIEGYWLANKGYPVSCEAAGVKVGGASALDCNLALENSGFCIAVTQGDVQYRATQAQLEPAIGGCTFIPDTQVAQLTAGDGAIARGYSKVALSGDIAVVGAREDDQRATDAGAAYVYRRSGSTWTQQAKLTASDAAANANFGWSVATDGDTIVVGAPRHNTFAGALYVFTRSGDTWTQQAKLTASDGAMPDQLGSAVAVSGNTILAGAYGKASGAGASYVFTRSGSTWTQQAKLTASDAAANDVFGYAVALSSDTAIVSAYGKASSTGGVYVFTRSGGAWTQQAKLLPGDSATSDSFGSSIALSGETLLVGAFGKAPAGAAYAFTRSGNIWTQQAKIVPTGVTPSSLFGVSVALSGNTAIIGASWDETVATFAGSAFIFTRSGNVWTQQAHVRPPGTALRDFFAESVALSGTTALMSASGRSSSVGTVFVYQDNR